MNQIHWNLSILTKSVHHKNLSAAADHVGLSQPQLSRIIAKLEEELKVVLLDRSVRRKSGWTKAAFALAEIYSRAEHKLESEIQSLTTSQLSAELNIGTLEGLSHLGLEFAHKLFAQGEIQIIHLDIYEIGELEEKFEMGDVDVILSFRVPGRQKYQHTLEIGFQSVQPVEKSNEFQIYSPFEFTKTNPRHKKTTEKVFVSNSLNLRKTWLDRFGGRGNLPTDVSPTRNKGEDPVYLVGSELMSPLMWDKVAEAITDTKKL